MRPTERWIREAHGILYGLALKASKGRNGDSWRGRAAMLKEAMKEMLDPPDSDGEDERSQPASGPDSRVLSPGENLCPCVDPENCTEAVPDIGCRRLLGLPGKGAEGGET